MFLSQKFFYDVQPPEGGATAPVKTNEQIDKQNEFRKQRGLEPLPYSQATPPATPTPAATPSTDGLTEAEIEEANKRVLAEQERIKLEQDAETERLRLEAIAKGETTVVKITAKAPAVPAAPAKKKEEEEEDDDTELLEKLSKKAGKKITSLDEILNPKKELTEDELKTKDQERETAKLNFGLQNKKISKQEIESFIEDTKNPEEVAYNYYAAQQKELDANISDKDIRTGFEEAFGLDEEEDSLKYKLGQNQINFIANSIIAQKHSKYLNLENEFVSFENQQAEAVAYQKNIIAKAPIYKRDVEAAAAKVTKMTFSGYDVEVDKEVVDQYVNQMLTPDHSENIIMSGYTVEGLEKALKNSIILDNFDDIIEGILERDRLKNQAGVRGIIPPQNKKPANVLGEKQDEERKRLQQRLGIQTN